MAPINSVVAGWSRAGFTSLDATSRTTVDRLARTTSARTNTVHQNTSFVLYVCLFVSILKQIVARCLAPWGRGGVI